MNLLFFFTGLMPYNFICVQTGSMLSQISSMEDVFTSGTLLKLAAIALVALVPSLIMKKLKNNKLKAVWTKLIILSKNCCKTFIANLKIFGVDQDILYQVNCGYIVYELSLLHHLPNNAMITWCISCESLVHN